MKDRKDYWARKEAEIGETVEAKFYSTYLGGDWSVKGPLTGVLFFSKSTLFFQSFFADKSLTSLFQLRRREGASESHAFLMPLKDLRCSFDEHPKSWWRKLMAKSEQTIVIHHLQGSPDSRGYKFSVDRQELPTIANLINRNR